MAQQRTTKRHFETFSTNKSILECYVLRNACKIWTLNKVLHKREGAFVTEGL